MVERHCEAAVLPGDHIQKIDVHLVGNVLHSLPLQMYFYSAVEVAASRVQYAKYSKHSQPVNIIIVMVVTAPLM